MRLVISPVSKISELVASEILNTIKINPRLADKVSFQFLCYVHQIFSLVNLKTLKYFEPITNYL